MTERAATATNSGAPLGWEVKRAGERALLVDVPKRRALAQLVAALRTERIDGVEDVLPAANSVLLTLNSSDAADRVRRTVDALLADPVRWEDSTVSRETLSGNNFAGPEAPGLAESLVEVPVRYDGPDLSEVAHLLGTDIDSIIAAHTGTIWHCAFVGFAPGFGYLRAGDGRLAVPRRPAARTSIPPGAVALAGGYSAVYPRATPGGWQLIGTTELELWDMKRNPPALIRAGVGVRFVDVGAR